jgi:Ribbon-helix-helix domain
MTKQQAPVRMNADLVKQLREYSEVTGVPVSKCIDEAVLRWLTWVAPERLEALQAEKRRDALEQDLKRKYAEEREQKRQPGDQA